MGFGSDWLKLATPIFHFKETSQKIYLKMYIYTHINTPTCKKGCQQKPQTNKHGAEVIEIKADFQAGESGYIKIKKTTLSEEGTTQAAYFPPGLQYLVLPEWKY